MKKDGKIIGLSFPSNSESLGLEPSILNVLPPGKNVEYSNKNIDFVDEDVRSFLCSVYISGAEEFKLWASRHNKEKIIVGGYHPTMFPEEFLDQAKHIVTGPCDDIFATISQETRYVMGYYDGSREGNNRFVKGQLINPAILDSGFSNDILGKSEIIRNRVFPGLINFKNLPRRDLYDIRLNEQIIPDKMPLDLVSSINTSYGCPYTCDFCCTPTMFGERLIQKPLDAIQRESGLIAQDFDRADKTGELNRFLFIRDENAPLQRDIEERLRIISETTKAKIYLFASANTLTERMCDILEKNNVYMVCLGLEDPTKNYSKNKNLEQAIERLKKRGIYTYLSFIVNPLEIVGAKKASSYYEVLYLALEKLKPEMICGNFLMPFPGTPLWDDYYHLVSTEDYVGYDSKTPFLVRNRILQEKMKYFLYKFQFDYFYSKFYRSNIRRFDTGDMLNIRFEELTKQFEASFSKIKYVRP